MLEVLAISLTAGMALTADVVAQRAEAQGGSWRAAHGHIPPPDS